jgi:V8-like Glu-specific endopeptidase
MKSLTVHWQFAALMLCACGPSTLEEAIGTSRQAVIGGVVDAAHPEVIAILVEPALSTGVGFCSGFLISPNLVMTARHCVSDMDQNGLICADEVVSGTQYTATRALAPAAAARFGVTTEADLNNLTSPSQLSRVAAVHVPPSVAGLPNCGNDVALLELTTPLVGIAPLGLRVATPDLTETFTAVGYGSDGANPNSDGLRRSRSGLTIFAVGEVRSVSGRIASTTNDWVADLGPCGGDSGAPALDSSGAVIGVMSRGNPTVCRQMVYTQVTPFHAWAKETVIAAAGRAGIPVASWAADQIVDAGIETGTDAGTPLTLPAASVSGPAAGCSSLPGLALLGSLAMLHRRRKGRHATQPSERARC